MKSLLIKALKILIVPVLFLALYPIEKGLVGEWEDKFGSEIVYLPIWKYWLDENSAEQTPPKLMEAIKTFEKANGRWPHNIRELVNQHSLDEVPVPPGGGKYCLDSEGKRIGIDYGEYVREVKFGCNDVLADILWIRGFHYVQGQFQLIEAGQKKPKGGWHQQLPDLYDAATDLDPHFIPPYRGGSVLVRALSRKPWRAVELLEKGVRENPTKYWELPYELAVVHLIDLGDEKAALHWLDLASDEKNYNPEENSEYAETGRAMVSKLRSYLMTKMDKFDVAIKVWEPWLKSESPVMRQTAESGIAKVLSEKLRNILLRYAEEYRQKTGHLPDNQEFGKQAQLVKCKTMEENAGETLQPILADLRQWDLLLWQIVRVKPPAGEARDRTRALSVQRDRRCVELQRAVNLYTMRENECPDNLAELVKEKLIDQIPADPGGGEFYLNPYVRIRYPEKPEEAQTKAKAEQ